MEWIKRQIARFKRWIIAFFIGGVALAAPVMEQPMTHLYSFQSDYRQTLEIIETYKNASTSPAVPEDIRGIGQTIIDTDGNDKVSVAVFQRKNGDLVYEQIPDTQYSKMGEKGGSQFNPTKSERVSAITAVTPRANAAIAFDATNGATSAAASSLTYALTVSSGGVLVVSCGGRGDDCTGVTYDGTDMVLQATPRFILDIYALHNPTTGSSANVVATFNSSQAVSSAAMSYTGVVNTSVAAMVGATTTQANVTGGSITTSITTTQANSMLVDSAVSSRDTSFSAGGSQTERQNLDPGSNHFFGASELATTTAGYTELSWSVTGSENWDHAIIELLEDTGGGGGAAEDDEVIFFSTES